MKTILFLALLYAVSQPVNAQINGDQTGAWYMYFINARFNDNQWGIQGDYQYRNWNALGDLEQLLLRTGITYTPENTSILLTAGYGNITSGAFGDNDAATGENRIYQEALLPQKIGSRVYLVHRFRYEQRWVDDQDLRSRYRYNIFMNIPLNQKDLTQGAIYTAFYNEIFINGQRSIGNGRSVEYFDRNRTYLAMGYSITNRLRVQLGWMQQTTDAWEKGQLQIGLHQSLAF